MFFRFMFSILLYKSGAQRFDAEAIFYITWVEVFFVVYLRVEFQATLLQGHKAIITFNYHCPHMTRSFRIYIFLQQGSFDKTLSNSRLRHGFHDLLIFLSISNAEKASQNTGFIQIHRIRRLAHHGCSSASRFEQGFSGIYIHDNNFALSAQLASFLYNSSTHALFNVSMNNRSYPCNSLSLYERVLWDNYSDHFKWTNLSSMMISHKLLAPDDNITLFVLLTFH